MKEISKKQLLNQINEADLEKRKAGSGLYIPRDEFAPWEKESEPGEREARGLPRDYPKRKEGAKESPDWFDRRAARAIEALEGGAPVSDMMIVDDPENPNGYIVVVQIEGNAITLITEETLKEENARFHEWATRPPNRLAFINVKKKLGRDWFGLGRNPAPDIQMKRREMVSKEPFPAPGDEKKELSIQGKILRKFLNPYFRELAYNVKEHLNNAGLPEIVAPLHKFENQTENINKYTVITNENVTWSSQNSFFYPSLEVYIKNAKELYRGRNPEYTPEAKHLVRQDNPGRNWSPTRPAENKDETYKQKPLTPIYQLNKKGYDPNDLDIQVVDVFTFRGRLTPENTYTWTIEFKTKYGKKLKEESRIQGGLIEDMFLEATASTGPLENIVGPDGSIASNQEIVNAFLEALSDIQSQILAIDVKEELRSRFAGVGRTDATLQLNESANLDLLISKIIDELKQ
jgi:hypothetical protein